MIMTAAPPIITQPEMLTQCGWCSAIRVDGVYHRCPAIPLLNGPADNVSHGICGECRDNLVADLGRMLD